LLKELISRK